MIEKRPLKASKEFVVSFFDPSSITRLRAVIMKWDKIIPIRRETLRNLEQLDHMVTFSDKALPQAVVMTAMSRSGKRVGCGSETSKQRIAIL